LDGIGLLFIEKKSHLCEKIEGIYFVCYYSQF